MSVSGLEAWLRSTTGVIAASTALLVAIVGVVKAGQEVYLYALGAPKTEKEAVRAATAKKHLNDSPVQTQPITVQLQNFSVTVIVDVYKDGDINLTVGPNSEWFPFNPCGRALWFVRH
jgi:hypothetical protein